MEHNTEVINHVIRHRRSVYPAQYTGEVVDDAIIEQMLENARWAPTHALTQPWHFVVFTGEGLQQLGEFQSNLYQQLSTAEGTFDEDKYQKLREKPTLASHVIAIGMRRHPKEKVPEVEEIESVACAVQNMYLTAAAYGVGAYWGSGGITYKEEAKEFFGLGAKDRLLGFFFVGTPKRTMPDGRRKPLEEFVEWRR